MDDTKADPKPDVAQMLADVIASYKHGMDNAAPRHQGELDALEAILQAVAG